MTNEDVTLYSLQLLYELTNLISFDKQIRKLLTLFLYNFPLKGPVAQKTAIAEAYLFQ